MPVFFIRADQVQNGQVTITGPLLAHLQASLRTQVAEQLWLCDEHRHRYRIQVAQLNQHALSGTVLDEQPSPPARHPSLILALAILKGDRMDWAIQKATELGVSAIIPLTTRHGVVRPHTSRVEAQQARWQRIALEAAQQSERWDVPTIQQPVAVEMFFKQPRGSTSRLILSERAAGQSLCSVPLPNDPESSVTVATGPEGGWAPDELALAATSEWTTVTLGTRILRAETAALASVSVIQSRLGELG